MKTLFTIHGDHPVLKRMDEKGLDEREATFLVNDLTKAGYENIKADITVVIQEGDSFSITKNFFDTLEYSRNGNCPTLECSLKKAIVLYALKSRYVDFDRHNSIPTLTNKLPITVKFSPLRLSRDGGHLVCKWSCQEEKTNAYMFDGVEINAYGDVEIKAILDTFIDRINSKNLFNAVWGNSLKVTLKVEQPVFTVKPIIECDDDVLSETELVIKKMMTLWQMTEEQATKHLKPVIKAMESQGIVFYRP